MITKTYIMNALKCSADYAQKLIENGKGDNQKLEQLLYQKLAERKITPAIREVK